MKNEILEKSRKQTKQKQKTANSKNLNGKTSDLYPVILDGGKTVIFISDRSKEAEIRERYELRKISKASASGS